MRLTGCLLLACGAAAAAPRPAALRAEGRWPLGCRVKLVVLESKGRTYNGEEVDDGKVKAYLA